MQLITKAEQDVDSIVPGARELSAFCSGSWGECSILEKAGPLGYYDICLSPIHNPLDVYESFRRKQAQGRKHGLSTKV